VAREENLIEVSVDPSSILSVAYRVRNGKMVGALDTVIMKVPEREYDEYLSAQAICIDFIRRLTERAEAQKEARDEPGRG